MATYDFANASNAYTAGEVSLSAVTVTQTGEVAILNGTSNSMACRLVHSVSTVDDIEFELGKGQGLHHRPGTAGTVTLYVTSRANTERTWREEQEKPVGIDPGLTTERCYVSISAV